VKTHADRWSPRDPDDDSPRLECGVFGVFDVEDASAVTALGLHALQHRGQEACGIVSWDGKEFFARRGLGHVAQVFADQTMLSELPGHMASGHVRYSTTGGQGLRNVQPLHETLRAAASRSRTTAISPMP